jgi:hypothetical protein
LRSCATADGPHQYELRCPQGVGAFRSDRARSAAASRRPSSKAHGTPKLRSDCQSDDLPRSRDHTYCALKYLSIVRLVAAQLCAGGGVTVESETIHRAGQLSRALILVDSELARSTFSSADILGLNSRVFANPQEGIMDTTTLLIIILVVLVLGGGGFYGRGRWF